MIHSGEATDVVGEIDDNFARCFARLLRACCSESSGASSFVTEASGMRVVAAILFHIAQSSLWRPSSNDSRSMLRNSRLAVVSSERAWARRTDVKTEFGER